VILENHLDVPADPDAVFALLNDVERVAGCLPGAVLDGREDDCYLGRVSFEVGPVKATYRAGIRFTEVVPDRRELRLSARGADTHGSGDVEAPRPPSPPHPHLRRPRPASRSTGWRCCSRRTPAATRRWSLWASPG
jgi:hypothetical protein